MVWGGEDWRGCAVSMKVDIVLLLPRLVFNNWVTSAKYRKWKSRVQLQNCQRCSGV